MGPGGPADLPGGDPGDPVGPAERLVEAQAPALQLQEPLGPLLDGLVVEDPRAGQVAAGAVDLVVGEVAPRASARTCSRTAATTRSASSGIGADVDPEQARARRRPSR